MEIYIREKCGHMFIAQNKKVSSPSKDTRKEKAERREQFQSRTLSEVHGLVRIIISRPFIEFYKHALYVLQSEKINACKCQ
jgi:hypothetical protein